MAVENAGQPRRRQYGPRIRHNDGAGHPLLFGMSPAIEFVDWPEGGGYAHGFFAKAYETLGVSDPNRVLHLCSGSVKVGIRVDIRPETNPTVVADCRNTPFPDESFDWIMADPPYSEAYADNLYGTKDDYPKPGQIIKEACRLLRPGGRVGLLHFIVPSNPRELSLIGVWGAHVRRWLSHPCMVGVREATDIVDRGLQAPVPVEQAEGYRMSDPKTVNLRW